MSITENTIQTPMKSCELHPELSGQVMTNKKQ